MAFPEEELGMVGILFAVGLAIYLASYLPERGPASKSTFLPSTDNAAKRQFEVYALQYSVCWIGVFGVVIATQVYRSFTADNYMQLCVSLSLPYLLQPILYPMPAERTLPLHLRYSFKANVWIAAFSFVGNYWYTHYFYSVLQASYTFPSHRLNNVPIALFFATHFYFCTYHTLSNLLLRRVESTYLPSHYRSVLFWLTVCGFAYFTAFMETLTISSYEHYRFGVPRGRIYSLGSAFYGIYFLVSYPVFYRLDEKVRGARTSVGGVVGKVAGAVGMGGGKRGVGGGVGHEGGEAVPPHSMYMVVMEVMGASMLVLLMLDACRLAAGVGMCLPAAAFCENRVGRQC